MLRDLPAFFLDCFWQTAQLQRPRALPYPAVMPVVLEHLSYSSGSPFLGEPSIFTRARGNTEGVWGPVCLLSVAHRHYLVLSLSFNICKMGQKILRPALRAPCSWAPVASYNFSRKELSTQLQTTNSKAQLQIPAPPMSCLLSEPLCLPP